jgi:acyl dehydratase
MVTRSDWMYGKITDEALEILRSRIGQVGPMSPESDPYTRTQIIRYLASVGDDNPLYWDDAYAAKTRWGGIIAPPRMLLSGSAQTPESVTQPPAGNRTSSLGEDVLRGVFAMISGTRMVFERPVRIGDRLRSQGTLHDVIVRKSQMAGRSVELINRMIYYNQRDEVVATVYASVIRMERGAARENRKYLDIPPARYTEEEIAAVYAHYERERQQRRGDRPRYWEDTEVGEPLLTLVKGPLTITDIASYFMGQGAIYYTNRVKHLQLKANPALRLVNPETNIEDEWTAAHWDEYFAQQSGIPRPYDEGPMRYDALAHLVSDWMGDDGVLRELYVSLRAPNLLGDVSWCTGKVVGKRMEDQRALVDLDLWITNQRNQKTTVGTAVVELPTRAS